MMKPGEIEAWEVPAEADADTIRRRLATAAQLRARVLFICDTERQAACGLPQAITIARPTRTCNRPHW
jgi:hypothetical protein